MCLGLIISKHILASTKGDKDISTDGLGRPTEQRLPYLMTFEFWQKIFSMDLKMDATSCRSVEEKHTRCLTFKFDLFSCEHHLKMRNNSQRRKEHQTVPHVHEYAWLKLTTVSILCQVIRII